MTQQDILLKHKTEQGLSYNQMAIALGNIVTAQMLNHVGTGKNSFSLHIINLIQNNETPWIRQMGDELWEVG